MVTVLNSHHDDWLDNQTMFDAGRSIYKRNKKQSCTHPPAPPTPAVRTRTRPRIRMCCFLSASLELLQAVCIDAHLITMMVQPAGRAGPAVMLVAFALHTLIIARCTALVVLTARAKACQGSKLSGLRLHSGSPTRRRS